METKSKSGTKYKVLLAALLVGVMASESALAQRRGGHYRHGARIGVYIGAPLLAYGAYRAFAPPYYYSPYYYPPVAVVPQAPPVYVEQPQYAPGPMQQPAPYYQPEPQMSAPPGEAAPQSSGGNMWYFCPDSKTYYPYVKQCTSGWQPVTPQPQG
jgi:hypothetical protein